MYRFLMASTGALDASIVRSFCDNSVDHFNWLEAQGVPFERTYFPGKSVILTNTMCLFSTGSEKVWPFREIARAVPRGHKVAGSGEHAGAAGMQPLLAECERAGVPAIYDARVSALVVDPDGPVVGAKVRRDGSDVFVRAERGVVIATGGFNFNPDMCRQYLPLLSSTSVPLGIPHNDGSGLQLAEAAGAGLRSMDGFIATGSFYPPSKLIKGILVNNQGRRFVAEDSYHGRTAAFIAEQPEQRAYLIVSDAQFAYPKITDHHHRLVDGWETVEEMEAALGIPAGNLAATLTAYNEHAVNGEDPELFKYRDWVEPIDPAPYAAFDVSFDRSSYLFMTLGGLRTDVDAQVLDAAGRKIPGLYAAGACAAHIPVSGKGYGSGMSLGPGSYFGRVAGRTAARSQITAEVGDG
jgi:succinate dehydrogenase/fumarate reductase flavoprotein subunit